MMNPLPTAIACPPECFRILPATSEGMGNGLRQGRWDLSRVVCRMWATSDGSLSSYDLVRLEPDNPEA